MRGNRAEATVRAAALATAAAISLVLVAGCGAADSGASVPPASSGSASPFSPGDVPAAEEALASMLVRGGLCALEKCEDEFVVAGDGTWRLRTMQGVSAGRLADEEVDRLRTAVAATALAQAPPVPSTRPTVYDGRELVISWRDSAGPHKVAGDTLDVDEDDPLVVVLRSLHP